MLSMKRKTCKGCFSEIKYKQIRKKIIEEIGEKNLMPGLIFISFDLNYECECGEKTTIPVKLQFMVNYTLDKEQIGYENIH